MTDGMIPSGILGAAIALLFMRLWYFEERLDRLSRLDAKVDALLKHAGVAFNPFADVPADVREALEQGKRILAIKRFRQATGVGLKEAKAFVDEVQRRALNVVARP